MDEKAMFLLSFVGVCLFVEGFKIESQRRCFSLALYDRLGKFTTYNVHMNTVLVASTGLVC